MTKETEIPSKFVSHINPDKIDQIHHFPQLEADRLRR